MAFVFQAQRVLHQYNESTKNIGPGSYGSLDTNNKKNNKHPFGVAPFNSTSVRRTIYDKNLITDNVSSPQKIGPGYYDIATNEVFKNNIKTYVNNKSVIIKFNSLGSNQFKSNVPRFKSEQREGPGPGDYQSEMRQSTLVQDIRKMSLQKRRELKKKANQFFQALKKQKKVQYKPSIPNKTFKLQKNPTNNSYNQTDFKKHKSFTTQNNHSRSLSLQQRSPLSKNKAYTWFKAQRKSIIQDVKKTAPQRNIGPGKYTPKQTTNFYHNQNQKDNKTIESSNNKFIPIPFNKKAKSKSESHNFKSKMVRTFFDQICYQTISEQKATKRQQQNFKTNAPGPGFYDLKFNFLSDKVKNTKYNTNYQFFGSTVERFVTDQASDLIQEKLGYFDLQTNKNNFNNNNNTFGIGQQKSFNKSSHAFLSDVQRKTIFTQGNQLPGPGDYQINKNPRSIFKPKKGKIVQNFGFSKQRFLNTQTKQASLDNQDITQNLRRLAQQQIRALKKSHQNNKQSFMFKSKLKQNTTFSQHLLKGHQVSVQLFGKYDVTQNDLSTKMMKKTMFLENLKKIQVSVPAFDSKKPRFQYYEKKENNKKNNKSLDHNNNSQQNQSIYNQQLIQKSHSNPKASSSLSSSHYNKPYAYNPNSQKIRQKLIQNNKKQIQMNKKSTIYNKTDTRDRFDNSYIQPNRLQNPGVGEYSLRSKWAKQTYNIKYHTNVLKSQAKGHK